MANKKQFTKFRFKVFLALVRWPGRLILRLRFGAKLPYIKLKDKNGALILSNHQTDIDGVLASFSINQPLHHVVTDSLFSANKFLNFLIVLLVRMIPKHKGQSDPKCIKDILECTKEGGNVLLFPEGNRTYAEFQFPITNGLVKLIRKIDKPIYFLNVCGGTGIRPRFSNKRRKGDFKLVLKRRLDPKDYALLTDEELMQVIYDNLKVFDSYSGNLYKSNQRAEYLERMLFVCPKCGAISSMRSEGNHFVCSECGLDVEYGEDLMFHSNDESFKIKRMIEWYELQKKWVRDFKYDNAGIIFKDENVSLKTAKAYEPRELIGSGTLTLTDKELSVGEHVFDVSLITAISPISGRKFNFTYDGKEYLVIGDERFNPLKYAFMMNRIDSALKISNSDIYYRIED